MDITNIPPYHHIFPPSLDSSISRAEGVPIVGVVPSLCRFCYGCCEWCNGINGMYTHNCYTGCDHMAEGCTNILTLGMYKFCILVWNLVDECCYSCLETGCILCKCEGRTCIRCNCCCCSWVAANTSNPIEPSEYSLVRPRVIPSRDTPSVLTMMLDD